jgi:lipid A 3-O-deacylase
LYFTQRTSSLQASRSDEVTVTLGVTGPPSLARFTQTLAHSVAPSFNRPTDWNRQIRFEPGAIVAYEQRRRTFAYSAGAFGFDVLPSVSIEAGNVTTSAGAGVQSRVGWNLPHPWLPESVPASVTATAGVSGHAVLRDIFLDGNTFEPNFRVGHKPLVGSGELGLEIRIRALSVAYRVVDETRSYAAGPRWHPWASMVAGVTFDR